MNEQATPAEAVENDLPSAAFEEPRSNYRKVMVSLLRGFSDFTNGLDNLVSVFIKIGMIALIAMLVPRVISQLTGHYVVFKEVNLPADIEKSRITKSTVQNIFIRNLKTLREKDIPGLEFVAASLSKEDYSSFLEGDTNLIMTASGFSIQAVVDMAADFFKIEQNKIVIDIIDAKNLIEIQALVGKNNFLRVGDVKKRDDIDLVLREQLKYITEDITEAIDPVLAGIHYIHIDESERLSRIARVIEAGKDSKSDSSIKWKFLFKAWVALRANEFQESLALVAQAKNVDNDFVVSDWVQLKALVGLARYEDAQALIARMHRLPKVKQYQSAALNLQVELARIKMAMGKFDDAENILNQTIQKQADFAYAYITFAELYIHTNKQDKAFDNFALAVHLHYYPAQQIRAGVFKPLALGKYAKQYADVLDAFNTPELRSEAIIIK